MAVDATLPGAPSVLFDAVVLAPSAQGAELLARESAALDFVRDAFAHLKVIGHADGGHALLAAAGVDAEKADGGLVAIGGDKGVAEFVRRASGLRIWEREAKVRNIP
jgi:catalase